MADVLNINREQEALKAFDRLEKRRLNGKFDFTIMVGNQTIYADQNILASGSDYFDAMLSHDTEERQNGNVEMKGVDLVCSPPDEYCKVLHSVGKFLYAVGGNDSAQSIEKYDLEKGKWQELVQTDPFDIAYSVVVKRL